MDYSQTSFAYKGITLDDRLTTEIKPHQSESIEWMAWRERNPYFGMSGGLLMHEPGLGKTIITLYTSLLNGGTTLVVCPAMLVLTWQDEIHKHTTVSNNDIYLHHGPDRHKKWIERPTKLREKILVTFLHCTKDLLTNKRMPERLLQAVLGETEMSVHDQPLPKFVITSFTTMQYELETVESQVTHASTQHFKSRSIFRRTFHRLVFDEAHSIRNHRTMAFCAAQQLSGAIKWFVTGTPVMNNTEEMYPYIRLLGGVNSKQAFTRRYPANIGGTRELQSLLKNIAIRRTKEVLGLPPKIDVDETVHMSQDERDFYQALKTYSSDRARRLLIQYRLLGQQERSERMRIIQSVLLLLLRLRQACCDPILVINAMKRLQPHVQGDGNNLHAATAALRFYTQNRDRSEECGVCMDDTANIISRNCGHKLCKQCWLRVLPTCSCPMCRSPVSSAHLENVSTHTPFQAELDRELEDRFVGLMDDELRTAHRILNHDNWRAQHSSKTNAIISLAEKDMASGHAILIASQWVQYLDILQKAFQERFPDIRFVTLTGRDRPAVRQQYVRQFQTDDSIRVCFASLGSSAEGITLTKASRVIVADLFWNQSKITQLTGRVSRISQVKDVTAYRMIVADSVEKKIQLLVEKKNKICQMITEGIAVQSADRQLFSMAVDLLS